MYLYGSAYDEIFDVDMCMHDERKCYMIYILMFMLYEIFDVDIVHDMMYILCALHDEHRCMMRDGLCVYYRVLTCRSGRRCYAACLVSIVKGNSLGSSEYLVKGHHST